ncbi:cucumisin-like [Euphorbia lathyris]|uniref:cucumisin-like n=1 Tax=Euphorbia lathyris TaxID=212925 RepID=UPI003313D41A
MASLNFILIVSWFLLLNIIHGSSDGDRKVYIVYMGDRPKGVFDAATLHSTMLQLVVGSTGASEYLLHNYQRSFNGFVAKLTEDEKQKMSEMEGVVSVFLSKKKKLHTSRSWDFMGFPENVRTSSNESNIVIGMLDSGIWPESQSFSDEGFGPPPTKWEGTCTPGDSNFTCNNKIIGARYYNAEGDIYPEELASPRDSEGHGTHTSSIAAGDMVSKASLFGLGEGTARGGVPSARISVYKICWIKGCSEADILAAFDDAIADGVDIISISVGGTPTDYFDDPIAIGAFHAMKNGILTSNSAGNEGPNLKSVSNCSPWSLSVAASTIDRKFVTPVVLGNGAIYEGLSVNTFEPGNKMYPIIYGGDAPNKYCAAEALNKTLVEGKIVLCDGLNEDNTNSIGVLGIVSKQEQDYADFASTFPLPASLLSSTNNADALNYITTTSKPTAKIFKSTEHKDGLAPYVASFSSRGPNPITKDILKPDLTAPGVDILAAWSEHTSVTGISGDKRVVPYNIISGTSMSCPHASAAAAYIKSFHPNWSPAAIKSALMTTAYTMSCNKNSDAEFAYGSGQINPIKATDPGLVYDAEYIDYVKFLCGQGYDRTQLQLITGDNNIECSEETQATSFDLNYPSFAFTAPWRNSLTRVFHRTVTNVGSPESTYKAILNAPSGLEIRVEPSVLSFKSVGEKQSFNLTVISDLDSSMKSGSLVWDDGVHVVRSPIVAFLNDVETWELLSCPNSSSGTRWGLGVYIVYMGSLPKGGFSASDLHTSMLQEATGSDGSDSMIYSYKRSFNGFAAKLTNNQMLKLAGR